MINDPRSEPYYDHLIKMGYCFLNYSEKHYIFERAGRVIKVAKSLYNHEKTDESYEIEKAAHDLLRFYRIPAAEIYKIYPKGSFLDDFAVLEEEKVNGEIYYKKDCRKSFLMQALCLMQKATRIKGKNFGMMGKGGQAKFSSWRDFLFDAVKDMPNSEREFICSKIQTLPDITEPAFVLPIAIWRILFSMGIILSKRSTSKDHYGEIRCFCTESLKEEIHICMFLSGRKQNRKSLICTQKFIRTFLAVS